MSSRQTRTSHNNAGTLPLLRLYRREALEAREVDQKIEMDTVHEPELCLWKRNTTSDHAVTKIPAQV